MRISLVTLALLLVSSSAFAADAGFYVGLGPGFVTTDVDGYSQSDFNEITGFTTNNALRTVEDDAIDGGDGNWRIYAGYQFTDAFALELGYLNNLGEFERSGNRNSDQTYFVPFIGQLPFTECSTEEYEGSALTLSMVGQLDWLFGRVGAAYYDVETTTRTGLIRGGLFSGRGVTDCTVSSVSSSEKETGLVVAVGARLRVDRWAVRAEIEMMNGIEFSPAGESTHYGLSLTAERHF